VTKHYWLSKSAEPTESIFGSTFPYKLPLGADTDNISPLPFLPNSVCGNQILVTRAYDDMFHRLLRLRMNDKGDTKGAVLTGQPGIGMSPRFDPHSVRQLTGAPVLQGKPRSLTLSLRDFFQLTRSYSCVPPMKSIFSTTAKCTLDRRGPASMNFLQGKRRGIVPYGR
jgi:hypothetical protein